MERWWFWRRLQRWLPAEPTIIEAGGYDGEDTRRMATVWPRGRVIVLEPVPELYGRLVERTADLSNVITFPLALGDRTGRQPLYRSAGSSDASSSLLPPKAHLDFHPTVTFAQESEVRTITLDDLFHSLPDTQVDLLWLDIQGMERKVLEKGVDTLAHTHHLFLEVHFVESYRGCGTLPELQAWLAEKGFRLQWLDDRYADAGNAFFVRRQPGKP